MAQADGHESSQSWGNSLDLKYKQKVLKIAWRLCGLSWEGKRSSAPHLGIPKIRDQQPAEKQAAVVPWAGAGASRAETRTATMLLEGLTGEQGRAGRLAVGRGRGAGARELGKNNFYGTGHRCLVKVSWKVTGREDEIFLQVWLQR